MLPERDNRRISGVRTTSPNGTIFVPGFMCQFMVSLFNKFNLSTNYNIFEDFEIIKIYRGEFLQVCENGAIIQCPGLFEGEMIVMVEYSLKSIVVAMNATDPDTEYAMSVLRLLINDKFPQCI